jgi:glucose/arabinose dehydrogenase
MTSGRHQIALTSILANVESARSAAITITITASTTESTTPGDGSDKESGSGSSPSTVCFDNPRECYSAHVIARGLRDAAALTALPDGRLLFIENGSHVRVIADDVLLSAPALTSSSDARLLSLAVDTSSSDTTSVFVAWTEAGADGRPHLNITRYREVAGTLGEGATIVTGLPFAEGGSAPLAVDSRGLLYVAVPATTADGHGVVLRFTRDGFVPEVNWRGLPVFSSGYALPTSLAIDVNHDRLWLAGRDRDWLSNVSSMKLVYDPAFTEGRPEPIDIQELPPFDSSLALFPGRTGSGVSLIVSAAGRLVSGALGGSGTITALSPVDTSPFVMLGPATSGAHGKWYALSGSQESPQSLLSLTPTR